MFSERKACSTRRGCESSAVSTVLLSEEDPAPGDGMSNCELSMVSVGFSDLILASKFIRLRIVPSAGYCNIPFEFDFAALMLLLLNS